MCNAGTVTKLSNERVEELDELDRVARTAARQCGHSLVIAQLPALSSNGRVIGRLTGLVSIMRVQTRGFVSCDVCIDILGKNRIFAEWVVDVFLLQIGMKCFSMTMIVDFFHKLLNSEMFCFFHNCM